LCPALCLPSAVAFAVCLAAAPVLSAEPALYCRAQLILTCNAKCTAEDNSSVDVTIDFAGESGSYCRGERCDDGKLEFSEQSGQWDGHYRIFTLSGPDFTVSGSVHLEAKSLFAVSDMGTLFGTCAQED